jgi:hypothetical protein
MKYGVFAKYPTYAGTYLRNPLRTASAEWQSFSRDSPICLETFVLLPELLLSHCFFTCRILQDVVLCVR